MDIILHEIDLEQFKAEVNYKGIKDEIERERVDYEECLYCEKYDDGCFLTEEEYNENIDKTLNALAMIVSPAKVKEAIEKFPKKKDGTFKKNQTLILHSSDNAMLDDDCYGYRYSALRFKAVDDRVIVLQYASLVAGW